MKSKYFFLRALLCIVVIILSVPSFAKETKKSSKPEATNNVVEEADSKRVEFKSKNSKSCVVLDSLQWTASSQKSVECIVSQKYENFSIVLLDTCGSNTPSTTQVLQQSDKPISSQKLKYQNYKQIINEDSLVQKENSNQTNNFYHNQALNWPAPGAIIKSKSPSKNLRSPRWISQIINNHNNEVQECYQKMLKVDPSLKGKMVLRFFVTPKGSVSEVQIVTSTVNSSDFEKLVIENIASWRDFGECDQKLGEKIYVQEYVFGE